MEARIGEVINGKYRLIRLLGDGGMGSVYEAQHEVLGTRVAIKLLHKELARRTGLIERFLQEARVAAQIKSPHVVQVQDVDRSQPEGQAFIVMELLDGEPLSTILDRQHKIPVSTSCEYTVQILEALEAAHALGVVHRDLKPENVFVTFLGGKPVLKLIDFGIAKIRRTDPAYKNLTIAGVLMGTAEYMAPEQARSAAEVDARSDIYSVGVMLYEMIAGTRPVLGDDARILALKVERGEVTPLVQVAPDVPREIAGLVHRAMAARVELRFQSATEMKLALQAAMQGKRAAATGPMPAVAPPSPAPEPPLAEQSGTGTLKGAPVDEVMAAAASRVQTHAVEAAYANEPKPTTERNPQIHAIAAAPPPYVPPPQYTPTRAVPRRGGPSGVMLVLLAAPLIVIAGIAIAFAVSGSKKSGEGPIDLGGGGTQTTATTTTPPAGDTGTAPPLQPLDTGGKPRPTPQPGPGPGPGPGPAPSTTPSGAPSGSAKPGGEDAGVTNPFPFPYDAGGTITLPSTLPSGFPPIPSTLPSGFPLPFPVPPTHT